MVTLESAVETHRSVHDSTGKQSKAVRTGFTRGVNEYGERAVLGPDGVECQHAFEWHGDVLICATCFADGT